MGRVEKTVVVVQVEANLMHVNKEAAAAALAVKKLRAADEKGITTDGEFVGMFELMKKRFNDICEKIGFSCAW